MRTFVAGSSSFCAIDRCAIGGQPIALAGIRHHLHQPYRTLCRAREGVERGFDGDDCLHERRVEPVGAGVRLDQRFIPAHEPFIDCALMEPRVLERLDGLRALGSRVVRHVEGRFALEEELVARVDLAIGHVRSTLRVDKRPQLGVRRDRHEEDWQDDQCADHEAARWCE